jgi:hypothetical protein
LVSDQLGELAKPIHGTVTDIIDAGFYLEHAFEAKALRLKNLNIRNLGIFALHGVLQLQLINCWIDELVLGRQKLDSVVNLTLKNTWIGQLNFLDANFGLARLESGGLLSLRCPIADQPSPFRGPVTIGRKFYLPRKDGEYKGNALGHLDWTSLRMHLAAVGNLAAAGRAHSVELKFERATAPLPTRVVSWFYWVLSDYGNSIGRPIFLLFLSWYIGFIIIVISAGARLAQPPEKYPHWKAALLDSSPQSDFLRMALLSLEPVLPLGLLRREPLVDAATPCLAVVQSVQSYCLPCFCCCWRSLFVASSGSAAARDHHSTLSTPSYAMPELGELLNNLSPGNRALGYHRVIPLIGIAPIPNRGRRCTGIGGVTIVVVIAAAVIGSRC